MNDREELFQIIWEGAVDDRVKDGKSPEKVPVVRPKVWALVHEILAAGYTKPGDELAAAKRAAKTLNEVIEKQCRDVLDVTGLHHLINEDGDGQWDVVWMRLFEMRDELADLKESTIYRERLRGDSWRDRAQEMTVRAEAAEAAVRRVRHLLDATEPNRYAILSMEGLRLGIRSAIEEGEPECAFEDDDWNAVDQ